MAVGTFGAASGAVPDSIAALRAFHAACLHPRAPGGLRQQLALRAGRAEGEAAGNNHVHDITRRMIDHEGHL